MFFTKLVLKFAAFLAKMAYKMVCTEKGKLSFRAMFDSLIALTVVGLVAYGVLHYGFPQEVPMYTQPLKSLGQWALDCTLLIGGGAIILDGLVWAGKVAIKKLWSAATTPSTAK